MGKERSHRHRSRGAASQGASREFHGETLRLQRSAWRSARGGHKSANRTAPSVVSAARGMLWSATLKPAGGGRRRWLRWREGGRRTATESWYRSPRPRPRIRCRRAPHSTTVGPSRWVTWRFHERRMVSSRME
jgi:hypothetical protein